MDLRRRGAPLLLATGSVLLVLLAAEAALRLSGYEPPHFKPTACVFDGGRHVLLDCYPTNPRGYFSIDLRDPATLARYQALDVKRLDRAAARAPWAVEVRYNALRFRGAEIGPKRPGVRRVAVLGDSFTEGKGVKEADAYPRVLEALLEAEEPGAWEVLNCGRRAADFPELYDQFHEVLRLEPDVVVYGMVPNDSEPTRALHVRLDGLSDLIEDRHQGDAAHRYTRLGPFDSRLATLIASRLEVDRLRRETMRWYHDLYGAANAEGWARTKEQIRRMDRETKARGGRFVLAAWPLLVGLEGPYPFEDVREAVGALCAAAGIERVDLLDALRGRPSESLWVHPVDMHPNEIGHRLVAERLSELLRADARRGGPRSSSTASRTGPSR